MARPSSNYPTDLELEILKVLWQSGPQTVEEVRESLASPECDRQLTHSSVITVMNIMVKKKYLQRKKVSRAFQYEACVLETQVNRGMLGDLVDRVFDGSATAVVLELLETSDLDADEIKEIRRMISRKANNR
ncbi:MAG: BlaI family penicillinase repressor [Pirellulaceae bacterium]|jgi:BlaI family penicillinase repressor